MSVKTGELENPEQDLALTDREKVKGARKVEADIQRVKTGKPTAEEELEALRARVAAVKATPPADDPPHCRDCFDRGVRAALAAIEAPRP